MTKTLDSILSSAISATPYKTVGKDNKPSQKEEPLKRLVALVPQSLKMQIKQKVASTPGETERTIVLRALKAYGFEISEDYIRDHRGNV